MNTRITTFIAVLVALGGFTLAVCIPAASADRGHNTYTEYCEDGTNTVYSEYDEYCETTTTVTVNGTTTVITSPVTVITTGSGANGASGSNGSSGSSGANGASGASGSNGSNGANGSSGANGSNGSSGSNGANGATPATDVVSATTGSLIGSVGKNLKVGTILAPGVKVLANADGSVTLDDHGLIFSVPYGAELSVAVDGVAAVTINGVTKTFAPKRVAHTTSAKAFTQYVVLPPERTSDAFGYVLPKGVSVGAHETETQLKKLVTIYAVTNTKALRVAAKAAKTLVTKYTVVATKGGTFISVKTKTFMKAYAIVFHETQLHYTKAAAASVRAGKKDLSVKFSVRSKTAKTHLKTDHYSVFYIA